VRCGEERGTLRIDGTLGSHSCYAPLTALAVSQALGIPFAQAIRALRGYVPPASRMRCVPGLRGSLVIDDTYNSSPAAAMRALDALATVAPRGDSAGAIAALGPMAELGPISRSQHEAVGRHAARLGLDYLVTVGDEARDTARAARDAGMPDDLVLELAETEEAVRALMERTKPGDVVLVKGSQSSRMERVATALTKEAEGRRTMIRLTADGGNE
jgi:UDP-N-acetylmuramoyl-tripeptide--D-alanyl-D-alanine ligase